MTLGRYTAAVARTFARPTARALAPTAALGVVACLLWTLPAVHQGRPGGSLMLTWWQIAALTVVTETVVLHVQFRREAQSLAPSELAVVIGLFFATDATAFLLGRVIGSVAVFVLVRRQPAVKSVFNSALVVAEAGLALLVFHSLQGAAGPPDPRSWLAACAATAAAGAFGALAVLAAVALVGSELQWREAGIELIRTLTGSLTVTVATLGAVHALHQSPLAAVPLAVSFGLLLVGFRAYGSLSERHLSMERLFRFSQVMTSSPEIDEILHGVLRHAREVLHSEHAEIVFLPSGPDQRPVRVDTHPDGRLRRRQLDRMEAHDPVWARVLAGTPLLLPRGARDPALRGFLASRRLRDAVLAPLHGDAGIVGTILVGGRLGEVRGFGPDDVAVLSTVASQAGLALQNSRLADRLRHEATHDPLTGLPNRAQLGRAIGEALQDVRTHRSPGLAVLVLDLVGFKQVNDTLGHQLGDMLLRDVGDRLSGALGEPHTLARLGGDEFAVLLPGITSRTRALGAARRLQEALEHPIAIHEVDVEVGLSVGISFGPVHGMDADLLIKHADAAMYQAKGTGGGTHLYDASLDTAASPQQLALVGELRHGITGGQLELHYQPQARLDTGGVVGVEALVRWRHPVRGLLFPDEFIALAERSGLIRPLTTAVLAEAIAACGRWRADGRELSMAVNLSARSILDTELTETVSALLALHDVPARALTLEITESSIIADPTRTLEVLEQLHQMGVRLSIDDFGTGYSSLSYLRQLPVQEVKIDKGFVLSMTTVQDDATIVRSIVDLGANLGLVVVAEGVEQEAARDELARMGCELMQGYLLARPLPADELLTWLQDQTVKPARPGGPVGSEPGQPADETGLASTPIPSSSTSTR